MKPTIAAIVLLGSAIPAAAGASDELDPYLQCVPYAREVSGIEIYGDAHTWWDQSRKRFAIGSSPRLGAVMVFRPHSFMRQGHMATVSQLIDSRSVRLDHANWSPIDGRRGQIEKDVLAVDVSPGNDWSRVRVWYAPLGGLGKTAWPVEGFIYSSHASPASTRIASIGKRKQMSRQFLSAFADYAD